MEGRTISTEALLLRIANDESAAHEAAMFLQLHDSGGVGFDLASDLCIMAAVRKSQGRAPDAADVQYVVKTRLDEFEAALELAREYYRLYPALFATNKDEAAADEEGSRRA